MQNYPALEFGTIKKPLCRSGIRFSQFDGVQDPTGSKTLGKTKCTVTGKCAYFEDPARADHMTDHLQQFALQVPAEHLVFPVIFCGKIVHFAEQVIFRRRQVFRVLLNFSVDKFQVKCFVKVKQHPDYEKPKKSIKAPKDE